MSVTTVAGSFITLNTIDSDHYVDGSIDLVHIGANQIDGTKIAVGSDARGDVLVYDGTNYVRLGADNGKFLRSNGTGSNPSWETAGGGTTVAGTTDNGLLTFVNSGSTFAAESTLTYDGNGNLYLVNPTSSGAVMMAHASDTSGNRHARMILRTAAGNTGDTYMSFHGVDSYEYSIGVDNSDSDKFKISGSALGTNDKLIIDADGRLGIGTSVPNDTMIKASWSTQSWVFNFTNAHGSGSNHVGQMNFGGSSPDSHNNIYIYGADTTAARFLIYSDGDIVNHDNSYGSSSDERIKQDIRDSNSQWDDIKAIRVRNFKKKEDVAQYGDRAWEQIGVIAQEVELVSPKLIREAAPTKFEMEQLGMGHEVENGEDETKWVPNVDEDGNEVTVKGIGYSVLYMKAFKALQEAMARIEILETKVTTLGG